MMSQAIHSTTLSSTAPRRTPITFFFRRVTAIRSLSLCASG